jgi:hypothetical protein
VRITEHPDDYVGTKPRDDHPSPRPNLDPTRVIAPWRRDRVGLILVAYEAAGAVAAVVTASDKIAAVVGVGIGTVLGDTWLRWLRRQIRREYPRWRDNVLSLLGRGPDL